MPDYHPAEDYLFFGEAPIRTLMRGGVPYLSLDDVCEIDGFGPNAIEAVAAPEFPPHGIWLCWEVADDGTLDDTIMLSPVGVWYFTHLAASEAHQQFASWVRKEAIRLCPAADPADPAMFLRVQDDGGMPPLPSRYSGRLAEWWHLKRSDEYVLWSLRNQRLRHRGPIWKI